MAKKYIINNGFFSVSASVEFHKDLLNKNEKYNSPKGGGWWHRDADERYILLYSSSHDLGQPDPKDIVPAIENTPISFFSPGFEIRFSRKDSLENAMKDYEVIYKVPNE